MNNELKSSYLRSFHEKERTTFVDSLFFTFIVFIAVFAAAYQKSRNTAGSLFLSTTALTIAIAINGIKKNRDFNRHIIEVRTKKSEELFKRKLLTEDRKKIERIIESEPQNSFKQVFVIQKASKADADDVYYAIRAAKKTSRNALIVSVTGFDESVIGFDQGFFSKEIEMKEAKDIDALRMLYWPEEHEVDTQILLENSKDIGKKLELRKLFEKANASKYFLLAALLYSGSFFVRNAAYLKTLSAITITAAGWLLIRERLRRPQIEN